MTTDPTYVSFSTGALRDAVAAMDSLAEAHVGWINFQPAAELADLPSTSDGFFGLFSGRGPDMPLGTWLPASAPRRGRPDPPKIGLQHGAGTKAKKRLAEMGHPVPDGWVVLQDYVKKGLVIAVPPDVANADVLAWLLRAAQTLTSVRLPGEWRAEVYR